jgi:hypothetical protein
MKNNHGSFSNDPQTRWITDDGAPDRNMEILERFSFLDPKGREWIAPAGTVVNGASIPRALWTVVGSPYTGDYRRASIVHDKACDDAAGDPAARKAADRMFYHACRAGGCSVFEATILYLGVRIGASVPEVESWQAPAIESTRRPRLTRSESEQRIESDFATITQDVLQGPPTDDPEEIERRADAALSAMQAFRRGSVK